MVLFPADLVKAATTLANSEDEILQAAGILALMRLESQNIYFDAGLKNDRKGFTVGKGHTAAVARLDMLEAEKGGLWPLSSYSPHKGLPLFPGFEERSMEEERFLYYEAKKNFKLEEYKNRFQILLKEAHMRIKTLQNPPPEVLRLLKTVYGD